MHLQSPRIFETFSIIEGRLCETINTMFKFALAVGALLENDLLERNSNPSHCKAGVVLVLSQVERLADWWLALLYYLLYVLLLLLVLPKKREILCNLTWYIFITCAHQTHEAEFSHFKHFSNIWGRSQASKERCWNGEGSWSVLS